MTWLIGFLVAHAIEIAAIGATITVVNELGQTAITAEKLIDMNRQKPESQNPKVTG